MHGRNVSIKFGGPLTPVVKKLMIINGSIFLLQQLTGIFTNTSPLEYYFGLSHVGFILEFKLWQVFTYMFLHGGWMHIIFNLLALWMFAGELEQVWGSRLFLRFYIYSGIGAGLFISLLNFVLYSKFGATGVTIGASGALYAILLAYGMTWPNREILLWFVIPIKMKYLVIGFGIFEFFGTLSTASGAGGNVSHIGHLGGLISGFIFMYVMSKRRLAGTGNKKDILQENFITRAFKDLRLKRKKKDIDNRIKAKKIIDELLEKIARSGMSSLSSKEKKLLEWARKNYHPGNNDTMR